MRQSLRKIRTPAMAFILLMGVVSLLADMTHEGARSSLGPFLYLSGASAAAIGFVTGLGEMAGHSLRLLFGYLADRKRNYWTLVILGYAINLLAVPALALVSENGWILAGILIVAERTGKAIRHPAKNTLVSFASRQVGEGKAFAIQEFLDQLGAFLGPVLLFLVLQLRKGETLLASYRIGFAWLGIPAVLTLLVLVLARRRFPAPDRFESASPDPEPLRLRSAFLLYLAATGLLALGFADFPLMSMHAVRRELVAPDLVPLLYAGAMAADAVAALLFGWLFDRFGFRVLMVSSLLSAGFPLLVFLGTSPWALAAGVLLWGVGMGAQESILKAAVTRLTPKARRSTGFGVFQTSFGLFWFAGSWLMGVLYDRSLGGLVLFSTILMLLSVPVFFLAWKAMGQNGPARPASPGTER